MTENTESELFFFDTDCISTFLVVDKVSLITQLYGAKIVIPGVVQRELLEYGNESMANKINNFFAFKIGEVMDIEAGSEDDKLFRQLTSRRRSDKLIGDGEAACICLAKHYNGFIVSSNLRDVMFYVQKYNLNHLMTGDILTDAVDKNLITMDKASEIWESIKDAGRRIPDWSFDEEYNKSRERRNK